MSHEKTRKRLGFLLYPLSLLYGLAVWLRNKMFDWKVFKSIEFDFPVICIGNLTVGGTGKTPHVEYLVELLHKNFKIAVLSRGYKRKTKGYIFAGATTTPEEIGDEPFQLHQKFKKLPVAVAEKRVEGVRNLTRDVKKLNGIILDDAYQHRYLTPGLSILLVDFYRPIFTDHMLPYGMLRDNLSQLHRANIVIVTKVPKEIKPIEKRIWIKNLGLYPYQYLYFSSFEYGNLSPVFGRKRKHAEIAHLREIKADILLFSGVSNPEPLKVYLAKNHLKVSNMEFPDHHNYTLNDIEQVKQRFNAIKSKQKLIITTEKDAVKLQNIPNFPRLLKEKIYYLPISVIILGGKQSEFEKHIVNYVKKNKKVDRLYR